MTTDLKTLDAWWRAANYLAVGQIYLMDNPLLREPLAPEHIKPRLLGHWGTTPGLTFLWAHLNRVITRDALRRALHHRAGARRPRGGRHRLDGGDLLRAVLAGPAGRRRDEGAVPAVLVPRRDPQPRRAGDPRVDPRGRRAGLLPCPRLRRRVRQPRPARRLRHRRRRSRDRPARRVVAGQQVRAPGARRHRAAGPAPQRLQDRQLHGAVPDHPRRAAPAAVGARSPPLRRRGRFDGEDPMAVHERMAATLDEIVAEIAAHPGARRPAARRGRAGRPAPLAHDRAVHAEGVDRAPRGGRRARRGHVAGPPGAARRDARRTRSTWQTGGVDALLPARGAVRRATDALPELATCAPEGDAG